MNKIKYIVTVSIIAFLMSIAFSTHAYVLNNQYIGYNITYKNLSSVSSYLSNVNQITKWNYSGGPVFLSGNGSYVNIYQNFSDVDNGTYGTAYYETSRRTNVVYYRLWKNAGTTVRNETVVHEAGHGIGLSHTQTANKDISVMRATGFNYMPYPLSDDKAGLEAKY